MARISPQFNAAAAMENTRVLAEQYPDRVTGTPAAGRAADYLSSKFGELGYRVSTDLFSMWLAGRRVEGQNVIAELPGEVPETVAVIAHFDGQFTSHQAAEDNASGVGTLLELARALRSGPRYRGLIFVATDGEEWGMIGARSLRGFFESRQTVAVISIDYLTAGQATALEIDCEGQKAGYSPLWLREVVKEAGILQGVTVKGPAPFPEWVERSVEVSAQDQGPLLRIGIPALNVSTIPSDPAAARARYHSMQDVFQNFDPATFQMTGSTVEQAVSYLDGMKPSPARDGKYLGLGGNRWLDRATLEWVQMLGLVPFMVACVLAGLSFQDDQLPRILWRYLRPGLYVVPPVAGLAALHALTSAGLLKRYGALSCHPEGPLPLHHSTPRRLTPPGGDSRRVYPGGRSKAVPAAGAGRLRGLETHFLCLDVRDRGRSAVSESLCHVVVPRPAGLRIRAVTAPIRLRASPGECGVALARGGPLDRRPVLFRTGDFPRLANPLVPRVTDCLRGMVNVGSHGLPAGGCDVGASPTDGSYRSAAGGTKAIPKAD